MDRRSTYSCFQQISALSTKATIRMLEEDFSHFGYPNTLVSVKAECLSSKEFIMVPEEMVHTTHGSLVSLFDEWTG